MHIPLTKTDFLERANAMVGLGMEKGGVWRC